MMTVREARKRLEYVKRLLKNWTYSPETEEAVDYAIQALGSDEVAYEQGYVDGWKERFGEPNILNGNGDYYDTHELIEVTAMCRHATDELVEWTGDEIVRCRDCKYAHLTYDGDVKYCDVWSPDETCYMNSNNFCSLGERKDEMSRSRAI